MSEFDAYIRQGEPGRKERAAAWQTAIGLQDVDGLKPSAYLIDAAKKHIEGDITIDDVKQMLDSYYKSRTARSEMENERTEEADKVSARIEELLTEKSFSFTPEYLARIHRHLFQGIFKFAGRYRDYDITKREWVLGGDTVLYASSSMVSETLNYNFSQEKMVNYAVLDSDEAIEQMAKFISGIWQIHPFGEGNTRTTAVFTMKYLQSFGFEVKNDMFKSHSWYFRNALVRANYNNYPKGIQATDEYLVLFFRNLILGEKNTLKNRDLLTGALQSAIVPAPKCQNDTLGCSLEELAVVKILKENGKVRQEDIAKQIGKSLRTVKRIMAGLTEKKVIARKNGKRNGVWVVIGQFGS
ncbi:MAG: Fic family protein [Bacteroidales bacterium]|nr:Fic family protein [Bacteroidales bacterium]